MGMDRGIHVVVDDKEYEKLQPLSVAKILAKVAHAPRCADSRSRQSAWPGIAAPGT